MKLNDEQVIIALCVVVVLLGLTVVGIQWLPSEIEKSGYEVTNINF